MILIVRNREKVVVMKYRFQKENSGVARNFRRGCVNRPISILPSTKSALQSKTSRYEPTVWLWTVACHWTLAWAEYYSRL